MNSQDNAPSSARDPAMAPAPEAAAAAEPGPLAPRERRLVQALAVAASLALLIAWRAIDAQAAWFAAPALRTAWISVAIGAPLAMALLLRSPTPPAAWVAGAALALLLAGLGWHTGAAYLPDRGLYLGGHYAPYVLCLTLALVLLLPYLQGLGRPAPRWSYALLYQRLWNNVLVVATALVFTLLAWLLLWLAAALFKLIGFAALAELLDEDVVVFPLLGLLLGLGLTIGRGQPGATRAAARLVPDLARLLLLPFNLLLLSFALALLVGDAARLWEAGHGAGLLLTMVAVQVALLNASWQRGIAPGVDGRLWHLLSCAALLTLPLFAGLAAYALALRVAQYGWTLDRLYGALVVFAALAFGLAYALMALGGLWRRDGQLARLADFNRAALLALGGLLLLTQSPLLDLRQIAATDLRERLAGGAAPWDDGDLRYLRYRLGKPGLDALQALAAAPAVREDADRQQAIANALAGDAARPEQRSLRLSDALASGQIRRLPAQVTVPPAVLALAEPMAQPRRHGRGCFAADALCAFVAIDLDRDDDVEWLYIAAWADECHAYAADTRDGQAWYWLGPLQREQACTAQTLAAALDAADVRALRPQFDDVRLGPNTWKLGGR